MRTLALISGLFVVALAPALALATQGHGLALLVYTLVVAGFVLALLVDFLNRSLPLKAFSWPPRTSARAEPEPIRQLGKIELALVAASWNESHLYASLRPLVREIVTARLRRRHRIDLERGASPSGHAPSSETVTLGASYAPNASRRSARAVAAGRGAS